MGNPRRTAGIEGVSIPFIAGQWSLLDALEEDWEPDELFQSPSLRGSGRFR